MKEYILKAARTGFAAGKVFDASPAGAEKSKGLSGKVSEKPDAAGELTRFEAALLSLESELAAAAAGQSAGNAEIFETEGLILEDASFTKAVQRQVLEEGKDILAAVEAAGRSLAQAIASSGNSYIRSRSEDILGVTRRLMEILRGDEKKLLAEPAIIVAAELSPAQLSGMEASKILGILTEKGSPISHVAILAGNLGVPYVYGSAEALEAARSGSHLIIDGETLIVDPDPEELEKAQRRMENEQKEQKLRGAFAERAGTRTKVCANISSPGDIPSLLSSGADGVGLFRSEFLFLDKTEAPSEQEQFEAYKSVAEAMGEKETVIRTLDLGSDKKAAWLDMPDEKNPALGCRGLRVSLGNPTLLKTQLRALLRAAAFGNVKVMVPMVTSVREVRAARACLEECAGELAGEGVSYKVPPLGIMVETPAAALTADQLAGEADFFSIGTNDLTQYTLALDREAQGLSDYYDPYHEAVMRMIEMTVTAAHEKGIAVSVCGELAADAHATERLIACGVDKLSVSLSAIGRTRQAVLGAEKRQSVPEAEKRQSVPEAEKRQSVSEAEKRQSVPEAEKRFSGEAAPSEPDRTVAAPADGRLIPMADIPDPVFSSGTMGACIGILPESGSIYAPCDGIVSGIAAAKHAITITASDGREILVHVGIDTVTLNGRGFTVLTREGAAVAKGDKILEADLDVIRASGLSPIVIVACPSLPA